MKFSHFVYNINKIMRDVKNNDDVIFPKWC